MGFSVAPVASYVFSSATVHTGDGGLKYTKKLRKQQAKQSVATFARHEVLFKDAVICGRKRKTDVTSLVNSIMA